MNYNQNNGFEEFCEKVRFAIANHFGEDYQVRIHEVQKNNGIVLRGLTILYKNSKCSPTIYLEHFFDRYNSGETLARVVENIVEVYEESESIRPENMDFFSDYEKVKPRLMIKLINKEYNEKLLSNVPHRDFIDLAMVVMAEIDIENDVKGSVLVHNNHICMWGVYEDDVIDDAIRIGYERKRIDIVAMEKMVEEIYNRMKASGEISEYQADELIDYPTGLFIITNENMYYGASSIVYPQFRRRMVKELGDECIIIPSSVHELIVIPKAVGGYPRNLNQMIKEVNCTMVMQDEVLSEHAYIYHGETDSFEILGDEMLSEVDVKLSMAN